MLARNVGAVVAAIVILLLLSYFAISFNQAQNTVKTTTLTPPQAYSPNRIVTQISQTILGSSTSTVTTASNTGLTALHVVGNALVDGFGNEVILTGVAVADQGMYATVRGSRPLSEADFKYLAQNWNAKLIRIPVSPDLWYGPKPWGDDNLTMLNQDVNWINKYGMYAIIDWHAGGNILRPNVTANTPSLPQTEAFWSTISQNFVGKPGVLYEIYNEPSRITWLQWQLNAQQIVNTIRQYDPSTVILVSGISGGSELSLVLDSPVTGQNIVYVVHPYPPECGTFHQTTAGSSCWPTAFGNTASVYPVFATEWGYYTIDQTSCASDISTWNWNGYNTQLVAYMQSLKMSWTAWVWYPTINGGCPGLLLTFTNYQPTQYGQFVQSTLTRNMHLSLLSFPNQPTLLVQTTTFTQSKSLA
jgi:hypothetical protein